MSPVPWPCPNPMPLPLPYPSPSPHQTPPQTAWLVEDKEDKEEFDEQGRIDDITDAARDFTLQLPWALLLVPEGIQGCTHRTGSRGRHCRLRKSWCEHRGAAENVVFLDKSTFNWKISHNSLDRDGVMWWASSGVVPSHYKPSSLHLLITYRFFFTTEFCEHSDPGCWVGSRYLVIVSTQSCLF